MVTIFFTGTKLLVLGVLPREEKFNQNHFLEVIAPELSRENSNTKRRVDKKQLVESFPFSLIPRSLTV
jgi:hypothetical protein